MHAGHVWRSDGAVSVLGSGYALPGLSLSTEELLERISSRFQVMPASGAAIARRLAIRARHHARPWRLSGEGPLPGLSNPELAAAALVAALRDAGLAVSDLGFLIGHTATPAQPLPSNIALAADQLGYSGPAIELRQACTGFAAALVIAFGLLAQPGARPVAIVGSEVGSVFLDPARLSEDIGQVVNLVQMGDGAGALILGPDQGGSRISSAWFGSIGLDRAAGMQMSGGGSNRPAAGPGPLDFDHDFAAIRRGGAELFDAGLKAAASQGVAIDDMDLILPHQTSGRIGAQLAAHVGLAEDRFQVDAGELGNTGSAAIWLSLAKLRQRRPAAGSHTLVLGAEATKYLHGGFVYAH